MYKDEQKKDEFNGFIKLYINCTWMYAAPDLEKIRMDDLREL